MSTYFVDIVIKTGSPIKLRNEDEVKSLLDAAEQHVKNTLFDTLGIEKTLKLHYDFSYSPQRHFNVALEYVGGDKAVPAKYKIKKDGRSRAYDREATFVLHPRE